MPQTADRLAEPDVRPEISLLLRWVRTGLGCRQTGRTEAVEGRPELDWDWLLNAAATNGVAPLLYRGLKDAPTGSVPDNVLDLLAERCRNNAHRNLLLTSELLDLLALLDSEGITAIPFKGPLLATSAYGDLSLRQYIDLDILVRRRDVSRVGELLTARGYRPLLDLDKAAQKALLRTECELVFVRDDRGFLVEIHWGITTKRLGFTLVAEQLGNRLVTMGLCGRQVPTLPPEESLLILCVHGSRHLWRRFVWICDVAKVIDTHQEMNWRHVLDLAEQFGSERMLFLGLVLANELLETRLPDAVLKRALGDRSVRKLAGNVRGEVFQKTEARIGFTELCRFHLTMTQRWRQKAAYLLDIAAKPRVEDCTWVRLPDSIYPLYYLVRPLRLVTQYGLRPLGRLFHGDDSERRKE